MKINACLTCGEPTKNIKFCSKKCSASRYIKRHNLICQSCKKPFTHNNIYDIKRGKMKYCSEDCKGRKWKINETYFEEINTDKLITLGQLIVTARIVDFRTIIILSDYSTLLDISDKLESTYKIIKSERDLYRITIRSFKLVNSFIELGFVNNHFFQDVPGDLWEGLKRTHCYEVVDGVNIFKTDRSKVALWVCDRFGGKMVTRTYKDVARGCMGCEWVVVWR